MCLNLGPRHGVKPFAIERGLLIVGDELADLFVLKDNRETTLHRR